MAMDGETIARERAYGSITGGIYVPIEVARESPSVAKSHEKMSLYSE